MTLDEELLERIEDFRYGNRIPTRSEAVRILKNYEGLSPFCTSPDLLKSVTYFNLVFKEHAAPLRAYQEKEDAKTN